MGDGRWELGNPWVFLRVFSKWSSDGVDWWLTGLPLASLPPVRTIRLVLTGQRAAGGYVLMVGGTQNERG
jgi:hypothetical protein